MVNRVLAAILVVGLMSSSNLWAGERIQSGEKNVEGILKDVGGVLYPASGERDFAGFLYQASDGHIWFGDCAAVLGMYGTAMNLGYYLSTDLERQFMPLVNKIGDTGISHGHTAVFDYDSYLRGKTDLAHTPTILVRFYGRFNLRDISASKPRSSAYEIGTIRLTYVEFLTQEWMQAWRELDKSLREIVEVSLTAPSEEKRQRLASAIERGSVAAGKMANVTVTDEQRAIVQKIEPEARIVSFSPIGLFNPNQWTQILRQYASCLRIEPKTPLQEALRVNLARKPTTNVTVKELGIVIGVPSDEVMAEKLVLGGVVVEKVLPEGKQTGLQEGDLILDYESIYDVTMAYYLLNGGGQRFASRVKYAEVSEVRVMRGNWILTVSLKK